jgi:hypothetical protein
VKQSWNKKRFFEFGIFYEACCSFRVFLFPRSLTKGLFTCSVGQSRARAVILLYGTLEPSTYRTTGCMTTSRATLTATATITPDGSSRSLNSPHSECRRLSGHCTNTTSSTCHEVHRSEAVQDHVRTKHILHEIYHPSYILRTLERV